MEELKLLIGMVADLPQMAIWVLIGFLVYKTLIIGSIYGVIKLFINQLHSWLTTPKEELLIKNEQTKVDRLVITGCFDQLISQLERVRGITVAGGSNYLHNSDIRWLGEAITEKINREKDA